MTPDNLNNGIVGRHMKLSIFPIESTYYRRRQADHEQRFTSHIGWFCIQHNIHQQQSSHAVQGIQNKRFEFLQSGASDIGHIGKHDLLAVCGQLAIWTGVDPAGFLYISKCIYALVLPAL